MQRIGSLSSKNEIWKDLTVEDNYQSKTGTGNDSAPLPTMDDLLASGKIQKIEHKRDILEGITRIFIGAIAGLAYILSLGYFTQLGNFAGKQITQGTNQIYPPEAYEINIQ